MGNGTYSFYTRSSVEADYATLDRTEIFTQKKITNDMDPANTMRECRDSKDHPNALPIIIALDVTGSMGVIPEKFIKKEMTRMMGSLYDAGLTSSQVLFMGIGDHECDRSPLQVGQFEAADQLLDKWLKDIYLEGGGGGNWGESYLLAWYYAARHTDIDSFEKRGQKGFLFTIGDEAPLPALPVEVQQKIFGENNVYTPVTHDALLEEAREKYNVYHLHITQTAAGHDTEAQDTWKQLMGPNVVMLKHYEDIVKEITRAIKSQINLDEVIPSTIVQPDTPSHTWPNPPAKPDDSPVAEEIL